MHQKDAGSIGFGGGEIMSLNSRIIKALEPMKLKVTVSEHPVNDEEGKPQQPDVVWYKKS